MTDDDLTLHFTAMDWKPGPPPEQKELQRWLEEAWRQIREDIPRSGFITQPEGRFTREGDIGRVDHEQRKGITCPP